MSESEDEPPDAVEHQSRTVLTAGDPAPPDARSLTLNVEQFVAVPTGEVTL